MNYLDGFSGYGGFHKGLEEAGFEFNKVYFSEMDKHAIANYKYNFPNSIYAGLIQHINRTTITDSIDLFTFGWPCQDNSIAGKRKGQSAGTRSGLLSEAVRIINEFNPRHFIAENVPGLLSVNEGIDYIEAIKLLCVFNESCPQYDIEMQLCNTKWVLPQNRERLFFVGHLRGTGSRKVFPIGERDCFFKHEAGAISGKKIATAIRAGMSGIPGNSETYIISANNSIGFSEIGEGDSINFLVPNSKTRRGRVGKGVAQTLDTACNQGVIQINPSLESGGKQPYQQNRIYGDHGISPALSQLSDRYNVLSGKRVRRFTEIECERLQGLPDNHTKYGNYNGVIKEIPSTQRYKLCGNGVTKHIVKMIAEKLYKLNYL